MTKHVQISLFKTHVVSVLELMASQSPTLALPLCLCRPDHIILKKNTPRSQRWSGGLRSYKASDSWKPFFTVMRSSWEKCIYFLACSPVNFLTFYVFFPSFFPCWFLRLVTWHMLKVDVLNTETHSRNTASPSFTSALSPSWLFPLTSMCRVLKSPHTHMSTHTQLFLPLHLITVDLTDGPHHCPGMSWMILFTSKNITF